MFEPDIRVTLAKPLSRSNCRVHDCLLVALQGERESYLTIAYLVAILKGVVRVQRSLTHTKHVPVGKSKFGYTFDEEITGTSFGLHHSATPGPRYDVPANTRYSSGGDLRTCHSKYPGLFLIIPWRRLTSGTPRRQRRVWGQVLQYPDIALSFFLGRIPDKAQRRLRIQRRPSVLVRQCTNLNCE